MFSDRGGSRIYRMRVGWGSPSLTDVFKSRHLLTFYRVFHGGRGQSKFYALFGLG